MGREFLVQNRDSDMCHTVRPFVSPAHLSLLGHTVADDLVHRGLGYAADREALAMPGAVVDQRVCVVPQASGDSVQIPPQRFEFVSLSRQQPTVQCLDPLQCLAALAMLPLPCRTNYFARVISLSSDSWSIESIILLLEIVNFANGVQSSANDVH